MLTITVVNLRKEKYDVYGGRPKGVADCSLLKPGEHGWLGNPFVVGLDGSRDQCIARFKRYFWKRVNQDTEFRAAVKALAGKRVGCFCKPQSCHLDVVKAWLEAGCPEITYFCVVCRKNPV